MSILHPLNDFVHMLSTIPEERPLRIAEHLLVQYVESGPDDRRLVFVGSAGVGR